MSTDNARSSAAKVMDEAIELAIEERSPYPEKATFIDADEPYASAEIRRAADERPGSRARLRRRQHTHAAA